MMGNAVTNNPRTRGNNRFLWMLPLLIASSIFLSACVQKQSETAYAVGEVGVSRAAEFGTIISTRDVTILASGKQEGAGMLLGAGTGAGGGSYVGDGTGSTWAAAGGAVAGAVIGDMIVQELANTQGIEYTVQMRDGPIKTIVQEKNDDNTLLKAGDKVMLQACDAGEHNRKCKAGSEFQRLIRVDKFPPEPVKKKRTTAKRR